MKFIILIALAITAGASANDTLGTLRSSGIVFEKSDKISMESEDLYISLKEIRVKYIFKNDSDENVKGLVVFPLPPMGPGVSDNFSHSVLDFELGNPNSPPKLEKGNPLKFTVKVNGKEVPFKTEVKPIKEYLASVNYYWEQEFPAGKTVTVEHSYLTTAGSGYPQSRNGPEEAPDKLYCYEDNFREAINKLQGEKEVDGHTVSLHYQASHISYILKTGANWRGPIKSFKLTLDKGYPENLISLCWDGLIRVSKTQFVSEKKNFTPDRNLQILIIDKEYYKHRN